MKYIPNYKGYQFPKGMIQKAIKENTSMTAAARSLNVTYPTFKKYAIMYEIWNPLSVKKMKTHTRPNKWAWSGKERHGTDPMIKHLIELSKNPTINMCCANCDFKLERIYDYTMPLMIEYKDCNSNNIDVSNIEFYCYNCWFLLFKPRKKYTRSTASHRSSIYRTPAAKQIIPKKAVEYEEATKLSDSLVKLFRKT